MRASVQATIAAHRLIAPGDQVVAAVSGGADSVCLARILAGLRAERSFDLALLHVHHGIRGEEADADETFVAGLADALDLPLDIARVNVPADASTHGVSLEVAGRNARIRAYREAAADRGAAAVAVGHTRNDRAETLLLRLLRGSGGGGLSAVRAESCVRGVRLIRPLIAVSRDEIERYLVDAGHQWREDRSNADDRFLRNRVRHELLPLLRDRFNPAVDEALDRAARLLEVDEAYLAGQAALALDQCRNPDGLDAAALREQPSALAGRVLRRWLMEEGIPGHTLDLASGDAVIRLAASSDGSASVSLPGGRRVDREYGVLRVPAGGPAAAAPFARELAVPGRIVLPACGLEVEARLGAGECPRRPGRPGVWPAEGGVNSTRVGAEPLIVRSRRPGDRMRPLGLSGSVKLQDVFVNAKISRSLRDRIPVVECRGEIVWVPGYRVARGWEVRDGDPDYIEIRIQPIQSTTHTDPCSTG